MNACSSFQEEKINSQAITNLTEDMLYTTHIAVIGDYVASCITFSKPNRVPAGNKYHVPLSCSCYENCTTQPFLFQPGMYLNGNSADGFEVFVHNRDEEIIYNQIDSTRCRLSISF